MEDRSFVSPGDLFPGTPLGITEGPHLYKWHGRYYLVTAEGGTDLNHAVTVAQAAPLDGFGLHGHPHLDGQE